MRREIIEMERDEFDAEFPLLAAIAGKETLSVNWNVWGVCTGVAWYEALLYPTRENSPKISVTGHTSIPLTCTIRLHDRIGYQVCLTDDDSDGSDGDDIVDYLRREYSDYLTKCNRDDMKYTLIERFIEKIPMIKEDDADHMSSIRDICIEYGITDFASLEKYRQSFLQSTVAELEQLQRELHEDTAKSKVKVAKYNLGAAFRGLVSLCQVLKVDRVIPDERTWMPYEDTYRVITLNMDVGATVQEFYCDAQLLEGVSYKYGDCLRVTWDHAAEGAMMTGIENLSLQRLGRVDGEYRAIGVVTKISPIDNSSELMAVRIDLDKPLNPDLYYDVRWIEEDAGPLPKVGDRVDIVTKRSPGSDEWYTLGNTEARRDSEFRDELDKLEELAKSFE